MFFSTDLLPGAPVSLPPCPGSMQSVNLRLASAADDTNDIMRNMKSNNFFAINVVRLVGPNV